MITVQCERCGKMSKIDGLMMPAQCKRVDRKKGESCLSNCNGDLETLPTCIENDWQIWGGDNVDEFRTIKSEFAIKSIMESWINAQEYLVKMIHEKTGHSIAAIYARMEEKAEDERNPLF